VYATHLRSFLTKDPLGNVDSQGLWNYVAADPINFRDPWGLAAQEQGVKSESSPVNFDDTPLIIDVGKPKPPPPPPATGGGGYCSKDPEKCRQDRMDGAAARGEGGIERAEARQRAADARRDLGRELARQGKTTADMINERWAEDRELFDAWFNERIDRQAAWIRTESIGNGIGGLLIPARVAGGALYRAGTGVFARMVRSATPKAAGGGGSILQRASSAAFKAAANAESFAAGAKHLAGAGGRWAKFAEGVNPNALLREALSSPNARFLPNDAGSFRVVTDLGRAIGTRGETGIRAVVDFEGHVVTWFPVRP
jgi:hypothetical protein